jgi:acyl-CoA synthetase (AMP-forming)/AMP-acid ligase II
MDRLHRLLNPVSVDWMTAVATGGAEVASNIASLLGEGSGGISSGQAELIGEDLAEACANVASQICSAGAQPGQAVCYLAPPGALGAVAFLAVSSVAAAAPLNPKATILEIQQYVERLKPALVIVGHDRADELAEKLDVPVRAWDVSNGGRLGLAGVDSHTKFEIAAENDVALILPTSGTTGLPKQVPLTHGQLLVSAKNIASWLALTPEDVSLTMMPLFHVHGLVAGLLAPLVANSTAAVERFDALRFGALTRQHEPTWFSAVPTMHAVLADRWSDRVGDLALGRLRFLRTSSSALPPSLLERLEKMYGVPVAEAYGMTEASHQIAANPIDGFTRRPGTVGVATGVEIRIENADELGRGQVLVRGPQVTGGYRLNDVANSDAFIDGWFRTGDEGYLDDGWLTLTGRLKEMINRAGEKVSPIEVEEALITAPGVASCVVFAVPDERLGEDVGAVVVTTDGVFDEVTARVHLRDRLASHKIPRKIVVADEIPLGPTGKVQRSRVAAALGLDE